MEKAVLITGLIFLLLGVYLSITSLHYLFAFIFGFWLIVAYINKRLGKNSLLIDQIIIKKNYKLLAKMLLIGLIISFVYEFYAQYITPIWVDPYFYSIKDFIFSALAWVFFVPTSWETFLLFYKPRKTVKKNKIADKLLKSRYLPLLLFIFLIVPFLIKTEFNWIFLLLISLSMWLFLDSFNYRKGSFSLLYEVLILNKNAILACLAASLLIALPVEYTNLIQNISWVYSGFPFIGYKLFGLPYVVIASWILPGITAWIAGYNFVAPSKKA